MFLYIYEISSLIFAFFFNFKMSEQNHIFDFTGINCFFYSDQNFLPIILNV